jgi:cell division protein FtsA
MSEILDFVSYHLKLVGLDNKMLNGGVVLTGGGAQLKHLIQLTEYVTGLNARIGYPTEHLAAGHIDELSKPVYSTCLGLILKGYDDFEHNRKQFESSFVEVAVPEELMEVENGEPNLPEDPRLSTGDGSGRAPLKDFWGKFKNGLVDMFKEVDE